MHAVANVQDTSLSPLESKTVLMGVPSNLHLVPFQNSLTACSMASLSKNEPTAMQKALAVHHTRFRLAGVLPCADAIVCSAQDVPFQRSAKPSPVAVHWVITKHETPLSSLTALPPGPFGVDWMVQALPFHTSASVAKLGPVLELPTASHTVVFGQVTPLSWLLVWPLALGVDWMVQLLPFHASARVWVAEPLLDCPTASHTDADLQKTPLSWLLVAPPGLGVDWTLQLLPFHISARVCVVPPLLNWPTASHTDP